MPFHETGISHYPQTSMKRIFSPEKAVLCAALSIFFACSGNAAEKGFKSIFNGKDLTGWKGSSEFWSVRDGAITGQTTPEKVTKPNTFIVWDQGELDDFDLRLKFKIKPDNEEGRANSGIQYRSTLIDSEKFIVGGYQADFEAGQTYSGILYEERGRGILALRGQSVEVHPPTKGKKPTIKVTGSVGDSDTIQAAIKQGDWNDYRIVARGNHLMHFINGHKTVDIIDKDDDKRSKSGVLALQLHQGPPMTVQFKDIRLKRLPLQEARKLVMIAGKPSHPPLMHEFNAGVQLLHKCLQGQDRVHSTFYLNGWPADPTAFDNADGIFFYMDGRVKHEAIQGDRLQFLDKLVEKGVGIGCAHYGVEVPADKGSDEFKKWIGGHYEHEFSVNPMWEPDFAKQFVHPITRGVGPFKVKDEWYFNMRWRDGQQDVKPILVATPSDDVRDGPYVHPRGPYPHILAAKGARETMMWAVERHDGGRGFGFTGGHYHINWGNDNFRKVVLNALLWMAGADVPKGGVASSVTEKELMSNLDPKKARKPKPVSNKKGK